MFEFVRTHQRLMQFVLLLFIFPSFAFFGLESYTRFRDGDQSVATVAGQSISQQEWEVAQREQMERFRQTFGSQFDSKMFDTPEARQRILDNLIARRALAAKAAHDHLSVSDQTVQQAILGIAGLTNAEGKFDGERYKALLAMQGMTPVMYEARLRQDLALQQVNTAIQATAFVPKSVASYLSDLNDQERQVQELFFDPAEFASQVNPSDEMLKAYYEKNSQQFEIPEQVKAEYVVLNNDVLMSQIAVTDADIKTYYEQNVKRYTVDEQRRARHILIASKKGASVADKAAAKTKAEKLLAQVRGNPNDFAKLAKEYSQDQSSAERGGDLDYFSKGMMVKPFEEATYHLKQGEISDLVESDFGYHIIQLIGVKPAVVQMLDEVKADIAVEIKKQQASKKYAELAEIFTNTVYEQADSLKPVVEKLKLKIETAANLTRQPNASLAPNVPYNHAKFLKALFLDDVIKGKHNTEAIEIAPNTLIAGRIVEYKPVAKRPFEEVKPIVRAQVIQAEAINLAKKAGEARLAVLKTNKGTAADFGNIKTISRVQTQNVDAAAVNAIMKADTNTLPAYAGVELPGKGYSVFRIIKVAPPAKVDTARREVEQQQVADAWAQQEMLAYIATLKQKAKVKILKPVVASPETRDVNLSEP